MSQPQPAHARRASDQWWLRPFAVFQTNLAEIDATLDVERTLDFIEDYGADTWLLNVGGIVSFYPSALPYQSPVSGLSARPSGDLIGDAIEAARRRGVRILGRLDFSKIPTAVATLHPDWLYEDSDGKHQEFAGLVATCPLRGYYQDRSLEILDEVLRRYSFDGFYFNWFHYPEFDYSGRWFGPCHCHDCEAAFALSAPGLALPTLPTDDGYPAWSAFAHSAIGDLTTRVGDFMTRRLPDAALILGPRAQLTYTEANNALDRDFWPHDAAAKASAHAAASPDRPLVMNCVSFVDMPYRMAGEQPDTFGQYLLQAISRGARPSTYVMGTPDRYHYRHLATSGEVVRFYSRQHELYDGLRPASTIALIEPAPEDRSEHSMEEYRGFWDALTEAHRPFDVVRWHDIPGLAIRGELERFDLVIAPALGELPREVAAAFDDFVRDGGTVLLTGDSGIARDGRSQLAGSPARSRQGRPVEGQELWSTYASLRTQPGIEEFRYVDELVPIFGRRTLLSWRPDARLLGVVVGPGPYGPPEKAWGHRADGQPALAIGATSPGRVAIVPWTAGATVRQFDTDVSRQFVAAVLDELLPATITFDLPAQVEISVAESRGRLVVHFLNQSGVRRRAFGPPLRTRAGSMLIHGLPSDVSAELFVSQKVPAAQIEGDGVRFDIPPIDRFEVIALTSPTHSDGFRPLLSGRVLT